MEYESFLAKFKEHCFTMSYESQLKLAIAVCKKMYFDYQVFSVDHRWGDPTLVMDGIMYCEASTVNPVDKQVVTTMMRQLNEVTPDIDDFGKPDSTIALNSCSAVYETLEFVLDRDPIHVYHAGNYWTDTIYLKTVDAKNEMNWDNHDHPMMREAMVFMLA